MAIRPFPLILGVLSLVAAGLAQTPAVEYPRVIPREEAFRLLQAVNDRGELFPESVLAVKIKYDRLAPEDCFGAELAAGWQLVGQSTGRSYGQEMQVWQAASREYEPTMYQIGYLYSTAAFALGDKTLQAGSYAVYARTDAIQFAGNDKTFRRDLRGRQIPNKVITKFELPTKLDAALFEAKSKERPRFSLVLEGNQTALVIGENKFPIRQK